MLAIGLVLGPSLMVISTMGILLYAKVYIYPLLYCIMGGHCCCLHVNYTVYKHFDMSLHVRSLDPTCVQNFRSIPLTVLEILGFKLKNEDHDKKKNGVVKMAVCF